VAFCFGALAGDVAALSSNRTLFRPMEASGAGFDCWLQAASWSTFTTHPPHQTLENCMPLSAEADTVWTWVRTQFDDPEKTNWCPEGKKTGPSYTTRIKEQVFAEISNEKTNGYGINKGQTYTVNATNYGVFTLIPQYKNDGDRGCQGNIQLWLHLGSNKWEMKVNLHFDLYTIGQQTADEKLLALEQEDAEGFKPVGNKKSIKKQAKVGYDKKTPKRS
jgi:hypothetical protein